MTTPFKLRTKIGGAEFEAEGPEESVREQFRMFMDAVTAAPVSPPRPAGNGANSDPPTPSPTDTPITEEMLARVFAIDQNENVVVQRLPQSDNRNADSVLLILYGYLVRRQMHDVPAGQLIESLRVSGISLNRLDRVMESVPGSIHRGGSRKGSRYALNMPGRNRAEELIRLLTQ